MRHRALPLIACLAACATSRPVIYAGPLEPLSGTCDSPLRAELGLRGNDVLFTPSSGTLVLHGQRTGATLSAGQSLLTPDHKTYTTTFNGQFAPTGVEGDYTTPRCRYRVHLAATHD